MEKKIRIVIGILIFGGSVWLASWVDKTPTNDSTSASVSEILRKDFAVAYISANGENDSPVYDSTLYAEKPHLLMRDGAITRNTACPVLKARLNKRVQPLFVNGRPIGFC